MNNYMFTHVDKTKNYSILIIGTTDISVLQYFSETFPNATIKIDDMLEDVKK